MKTRIAFIALTAAALSLSAQEQDDMYFNSKDRAKINSQKEALAMASRISENETVSSRVNPTDSYSARGENPEYVAASKFSSTTKDENPQYFLSGYQPVAVNQNLNQYSNVNSFYSPYGNNYGYNSFYNPYSSFYGYSPYSNFYSPYYGGLGSGWSTSLGYTWGSMGSGWYSGMSYGYGNMWGSPYNSLWNSYYGYNNFYGYNYGGYYPSTVVIVNNGDNGSNVAYRRRVDRSSYSNNGSYYNNDNTSTSYTRNGRSTAGGRVSSDNSSTPSGRTSSGQSDYYDRSWRRNASVNPSGSSDNSRGSSWGRVDNSSNNGGRSSWINNGNTGGTHTPAWGGSNDGGRTSTWGGDAGRSNSSFGSFGGGSSGGGRSSGGGGGSSVSHSRGRN